MERSFTAVILDSATTTFQTPEMYESCLFLELKMWLYEKIYPGGLAARSGTEFPWSPQLRNSAEWDWVQIFLENKFGGECRHGRMMSFCSVLSFPAYKYQEKVSMNFFNGPFGHLWTVHGWLHLSWFAISASSVIIFERPSCSISYIFPLTVVLRLSSLS